MRKFTLFLALMVAMVTTAFAANVKIDVSKQYYLKGSAVSGTDVLSGYLNLVSVRDVNTNAKLFADKQVFTFEEVWEGTDPYYLISAMVASGTSGEAKTYLASGSWDAQLTTEAAKAERFVFEVSTSGTVIKRVDSGKYLKVNYIEGDKSKMGVYTDGDATNAATWTLEEVAAEPEEGIDTSKEYYLYSSWSYGMNNGYLTIGTKSGSNYGVVCMSNNKKAFKLTPSGDGYVLSTLNNSMPGMEYDEYIDCSHEYNVNNNAMNGSVLYLEMNTNGKYNIRCDKGYFKIEMISYGTDGSGYHVFSNGAITDAAEWELVAVAAEPEAPAAEPLNYVSHTPNAVVESITTVTVEFDREVGSFDGNAWANVKLGTGRPQGIVINGNAVTFTFAKVTAAGEYKLTIPAEYIVATDGGKNAEAITLTITVEAAAAAPVWSKTAITKKDQYGNCISLEEISVEFSEEIELAANVEPLKLMNGEDVVAEFVVGDNAEINGKVLGLYLDEAIVPEVTTTYKVVIPAGYVKTKGTELALAADKTISVKVVVPFVIKNITPANGTTRNIVIECSEAILNYNYHNYLKLRNTANGSEIAISADYTIEGNVLTITPATAVPNGTYTLEGLNRLTAVSELSVTLPEGYTYTITVDAPLYDASEFGVTMNPTNGYSFESVKFAFAEVVEVVGAGPYAVVYNENDEVVTEITTYTQASLAAYRKNATFNLAEKITAAGTYTVKFNAAIIKGTESGKVYAGGEYEFTVTKRPVSITPVDAPKGNVEEIYPDYEILIQYADEVTVDTEKAVTMTVGENTYTATLTTEDGSWGYTISIVFDAEFAYGDYTFTIPAGLYTVNGTPNEKEVYEFTYAEPVLLKVVSITPAVGTVESFSAITIEFNTPVVCEYGFDFAGCYFMQDAYTWQPRQTVTFIATDMEGQLATISAPGEYVFDLLSAVEWGTKLADDQDRYITWTIEEGETTAIDAVNAEAENAVIYDLTGRRVEKITKAGIYVINGVKKVVK